MTSSDTSSRWDHAALRAGAGVIAVCAVPLAVITRFAFDENDRSGLASFLSLLTLGMFVIGAGVAAWRQERDTPLSHALVTAISTFVAIQIVFALIRALGGSSINVGRILVSLTLTALAGLVGGFLGSFLRSKGIHAAR